MGKSEENTVRVSKRLREQRAFQKYRHRNARPGVEYDAYMWNSGGQQFFGLYYKNHYELGTSYLAIHLDDFYYYYSAVTGRREGDRTEKSYGGITIRPELASSLYDFLMNKPSGETFIISQRRGGYHLSFEKHGLFGPTELRWRYRYDSEEWNTCFSLPRKERNRLSKSMKNREKREELWFAPQYANLLALYLETIIP